MSERRGVVNLRGSRVVLRAVEAEDIDFMYGVENDLSNWGVSGTTLPFSQYILSRFVESQIEDISISGQRRFIITTLENEPIGTVDLFDYDLYNHRAGVGIYIIEPKRGEGYATESIELISEFGKRVLQLHQLWCDVASDNLASLRLFESCGFSKVGTKRDWMWQGGEYCDVVSMQRVF